MAERDYRDLPGISSTQIKQFLRDTPAAFEHWRETHVWTYSDAMRLGTAIHMALLEPEALADHVAVYRGPARNIKAGKEAWAEFCNDWGLSETPKVSDGPALFYAKLGVTLLDAEQWDIVERAVDLIRQQAATFDVLLHGEREAVYLAPCPITGLQRKAKLDVRGKAGSKRVVVDIKTTNTLDHRKLFGKMKDFDYATQLAYYADVCADATGEPVEANYILWIRTEGAVDFEFWRLPDHVIEHGRKRWQRGIKGLAECMESGVWPGRSARIFTPEFPAYVTEESDND